MLLSRKRARDVGSPLLRGPEELLATSSDPYRHHHHLHHLTQAVEGKRLLRDLVDTRTGQRDALVDLLARLQERELPTATTNRDQSLEMSRARLSSQELFLSVVLEWQRSPNGTNQVESPTAAVFRHDRSFHSASNHGNANNYASSSSCSSAASSYASSDDEGADEQDGVVSSKRPRVGLDEEVSPTSVHHLTTMMASPSPLRLNASTKRIGVYSPCARQEMLQKYMAKRARRLSQNKVRYGVRKTLANARPRVKGRFVKTEQPLTAALVQLQVPAPVTN